MKNPMCDNDKCKREIGEVRVLPYGGGGNMILCRACFDYEIRYRKERISEGVEYELPRWEDCQVYSDR